MMFDSLDLRNMGHVPVVSKNEILSIEDNNGYIVLRSKLGGQVAMVYFIKCYKIEKDSSFFGQGIKLPFISIIRLNVHPDYRKFGWATIIMNRIVETYSGRTIVVNAFPDNEKYMSLEQLINFYKKFGFEILKPSEEGMFLIKTI